MAGRVCGSALPAFPSSAAQAGPALPARSGCHRCGKEGRGLLLGDERFNLYTTPIKEACAGCQELLGVFPSRGWVQTLPGTHHGTSRLAAAAAAMLSLLPPSFSPTAAFPSNPPLKQLQGDVWAVPQASSGEQQSSGEMLGGCRASGRDLNGVCSELEMEVVPSLMGLMATGRAAPSPVLSNLPRLQLCWQREHEWQRDLFTEVNRELI